MKTFWITLTSLILITLCLFVGLSITAYIKGFDNMIEWMRTWPIFKDSVKSTLAVTTNLLTWRR